MIYGRVYKIYCNITGEYYYGSTTQTLAQRLSKHKNDYKKWKNGKTNYTTSFRIIERENYTISLLEEGEFQNKDFMKARERHYIENFECVNKNVPTRTDKEYREAHKEQIKEYLQAHREQKKEYDKEYREAHKEQIKEYDKEYYEANKEHIAEYHKEWYVANRQRIAEYNKEKMKQKHTCECGSIYRSCDKSRHEKTKKHLAIKN